MTKIEMLVTQKCKENFDVKDFEKGKVYDITDESLVKIILDQGWGITVDEKDTETVDEELEGRDVYDAMTVKELKTFAEVTDIELGKAIKKDDIVDVIWAVMDASSEEVDEVAEEVDETEEAKVA